MKQKLSNGNRSRFLGIFCLMATLLVGVFSCRPDYDLDKRMPENLGSSIYEYLQERGFKTYVRLIEDLNYKNVLAKTGSKTLFVADEEAVERFYASGVFKKADGTPVSCYEDLSLAQKKMMLYGSMLNNVYQVAMLSSSEGPTIGDCMRRVASNSIYDSLPVITVDEMPNSEHWAWYIKNNKPLPAMRDATIKPMVFFVNKFLTMKKITDDDYDFLFNQGAYSRGAARPGREPADASVNGVKIVEPNCRCFNGFVHVMEEVIYSLPNMAEYLEKHPKTQIYSALVERFCAPYFKTGNDDVTDRVRTLMEAGELKVSVPVDTVMEKRYFAKRSKNNSVNNYTPFNKRIDNRELLKFDPGWNSYYTTSTGVTTAVALQQNMGVMLVPTDEAMSRWWNEGGGRPLKERYGKPEYAGQTLTNISEIIDDMRGVPNRVIVELLNNNLLSSFVGSVPSKFENVLDDANDPMGITTSNVDSVAMCCNGAIYFTNVVFSPTSYRSVSFPAMVNKNLSIIDWAISKYEFNAYLNSMVSTYSFFIPTVSASTDPALNGALLYIDPISFGNPERDAVSGHDIGSAVVFFYNEKNTDVEAKRYRYDLNADSLLTAEGSTNVSTEEVQNRLSDLLDYHIVIGDVEDARKFDYFQTKGRGTIKVERGADDSIKYVYGGYQIENGKPAKVINRYDMTSSNGNGKTYIIDRPLQTSRKSVYNILSDVANYPEFSTFFQLLQQATGDNGQSLFVKSTNKHVVGSLYNISSFNTYHYTVYVPTNASLQALIDAGQIATADKIAEIDDRYADMRDAVSDAQTAGDDDLAEQLENKYLNEMIRLSRLVRGAEDTDPNIATDTTFTSTMYTKYLSEQTKNFVKYHIQDNAVYYGAEFKIDTINVGYEASYETAFMNKNNQFEKLRVESDNKGIRLKDRGYKVGDEPKSVLRVNSVSGKPLYNIMCREYEYDTDSYSSAKNIETSSYIVIHQIDKPLCNGVIKF